MSAPAVPLSAPSAVPRPSSTVKPHGDLLRALITGHISHASDGVEFYREAGPPRGTNGPHTS